MVVERCWAGVQGQVLASTLPRAQNRAAKGLTLQYYEDHSLFPSSYIIYLWPDLWFYTDFKIK